MPRASSCTILSRGQGTSYWIVGDHICFKLTSENTNNRYVFAETIVAPQHGPPPHMHHREDELFYVLEGEFELYFKNTFTRATAGDSAFFPRNVPHTFKCVGGQPGRLLIAVMPSGFDKFVAEAGCPATDDKIAPPPDMQRVMTAFHKYDLELLLDQKFDQPAATPPAGKDLWVLGQHVRLKQTSAATNGTFCMAELFIAPGGGVPPHSHRDLDEIFYALEGICQWTVGDQTLTTSPGDFVRVPTGVMHGFVNTSDKPAKLLDYHTGSFERFFETIGVPYKGEATPPPMPNIDHATLARMLDGFEMDIPKP